MTGKLIYSSANPLLVENLRNVLELEGIACAVRHRDLAPLAGVLPDFETWPQLWVLDESRIADAERLIAEALDQGGAPMPDDWPGNLSDERDPVEPPPPVRPEPPAPFATEPSRLRLWIALGLIAWLLYFVARKLGYAGHAGGWPF